MLNTRQNYHHSVLPKIGEIGYLVMGHDRWGGPRYYQDRKERVIVSHYPLCDNCLPWSLGIHTAWFKRLSDSAMIRISGFYFDNN